MTRNFVFSSSSSLATAPFWPWRCDDEGDERLWRPALARAAPVVVLNDLGAGSSFCGASSSRSCCDPDSKASEFGLVPLSGSSDGLLGAVGRRTGRLATPVGVEAESRVFCRVVLVAGPDIDGREVRVADDGGGGGPIDVFPAAGRNLGGATDGREVPLTEERWERGVEAPDICLVGDLTGGCDIARLAYHRPVTLDDCRNVPSKTFAGPLL